MLCDKVNFYQEFFFCEETLALISLTSKFWNQFHDSDDEDVCALVVQLVDDGDIGDEDDDDIDVVLGSDFGKIGGIRGEGSGYQVNIPETCRSKALCHML